MKKYIYISAALLISISLSACTAEGPITFYKPVEHLMKIDSEADLAALPDKAPDMKSVSKQKNKDIQSSYELSDGLEAFKSLDIVKEVNIENDKIDVEFIAKAMNDEDKELSIKETIWQNALFLFYTIIDTFPEIKNIRLHAEYYYLDKYGKPYNEVIFITNIDRKVLEKFERDYFRPAMLEHVIDYYMADEVIGKYEKEKKE